MSAHIQAGWALGAPRLLRLSRLLRPRYAFATPAAPAASYLRKTLRCRPVDRLTEEREVMRPLPEQQADTDRRWVVRVPADPHLRFDTNDCSLDPNLVGRRVEVRAAAALDSGEFACRHERVFAKNRTITALEHARALKARRRQSEADEVEVEVRPLEVYDRCIDDEPPAACQGVRG